MYTRNCIKRPIFFLVLGAIFLALIAACGGSDPEELEISIKLENGSLTPATIEVKQGDMVTLNIETEEAGEFHLHGYDIEMDIPAGVTTDFFVLADITGRFKITFHAAGDEHEGEDEEHDDDEEEEMEIGILEVRPR